MSCLVGGAGIRLPPPMRYRVTPGITAALSLRLTPRARRMLRVIPDLDRSTPDEPGVTVMVRVYDDSVAGPITTPTGTTICLQPAVPGHPCLWDAF